MTCVRLKEREQGRVSFVGKWCLQTLRLEKTQWSGFELGRRKLGNGRSRGCKCWCAGKRKGQGWGLSRDDDDAKLIRYRSPRDSSTMPCTYCVQKMPRTRELSLRSSFFVPLHLTSEPVIDLSQTVPSTTT